MLPPLINDISTDIETPPQFVAIAQLKKKRNYDYPKRFGPIQRSYYRNLEPLVISKKRDLVFEKVEEVARGLWNVVHVDRARFSLEAVAITPLLRYRDDLVVEVRQVRGQGSGQVSGQGSGEDESSQVHMRSKSRLGRGDFGANAKRIQSFFEALKSQI